MAIDRNNNENNQILIEKLRAIIYIESHKPVSERDMDLIDECVDYLMELEDDKDLTVEHISTAKENFMQLVEDKYPTKSKPKAQKLRFKPFLVAACFVVLMVIANFVAMACGVDTMSILKEWGYRIVEMFEGEKVEYKEITIIKEQQPLSFNSIDKFLKDTDFNVLYPSHLPSNIKINTITVSGSYDSQYNYTAEYNRIMIITSNPKINFIADTCPDSSQGFLNNKDLEIKTINGYKCYLNIVNGNIECSFVHNNVSYFINSDNYDNLVTIIENLKEDS